MESGRYLVLDPEQQLLASETKRRYEASIYRKFAFGVMVIGISIGFAKLMGWLGRF